MSARVLFLDSVHPILQTSLEKDGYSCEQDYSCSVEELAGKIHNYTGVVIRSRLILDEYLLEKAKNLKFIARSGSGLENIDVNCADKLGIRCINSPEGNRDAVGEHALGMLLGLFNHLSRGNAEVKKGIWEREKNRGLEIGGKTIGIIGYGNTGGAFARKLSGFDCKILAHDSYKKDFSDNCVTEASPEEIFSAADVVSMHIPYNKGNHYIVNKNFLNSFQKNIFVINTSRGKVVKTDDLVEALKTGKVRGACLDVLEYETHSFEKINRKYLPASFQYLSDAENVLLSPHVAGWTEESYYKLSKVLYDKVSSYFAPPKR